MWFHAQVSKSPLGRKMTKSDRANRLMRDFGKRLRAARITAGWEEAADFAADLGVEAPRYRRYERGHALPPIDLLADISRLTGATLDHLLMGRKPRSKP